MSTNFIFACKTSEIPTKQPLCVSLEGVALAIGQSKGEFYAVANLCTHAASTFDGGKVKAHFLVCPLHGVMFDMRDGVPRGNLAKSALTTYCTQIRNDDELWVSL